MLKIMKAVIANFLTGSSIMETFLFKFPWKDTNFSENFQSKSRAWARAFKCELLSLVGPRKYSNTFEHTLYHKQMSGAYE